MTPERTDIGDSRLRLQTIIRLRWVAVAGQIAAVVTAALLLGFPVPYTACSAVIGLSAALNIFLHMAYPRNLRLHSSRAALMLGYDLVQLSVLLYLTGGLQNPFALLMVVPVAVSASTQPIAKTAILGCLAVLSASLLTRYHWPLPWTPGQLELPYFYIYGVWTALVICIVFMAAYAWRTAEETRQMSDALAATEMALAREQQLSALNSLAAAAAHELGTPLSTITLVTKELEREIPEDSAWREDIVLLRTQAARCRDILSRLTQNSGQSDAVYSQMTVGHLIEEVIEPFRVFGIEITVTLRPQTINGFAQPEPVFPRNAGVIYALTNLVENSVDYASSMVDITADWDSDEIRLTIADDGPGFAPNVIGRLGEPYVTTRPRAHASESDATSGMGLGVFIAKTLLERYGAVLKLENRKAPESGARIDVVWGRGAKTEAKAN
jgi:two-component system, sensor histidine kinase RegB